MQIGSVGNRIADVDPDPEKDSPIGRLVTVEQGNFLLHSDCEAQSSVDTIKYHQQGVAAGLNNSTAMAVDGWIDNFTAEPVQPFKRFEIIQPYQATVTNHVGMDDRHKSPRIGQHAGHARCSVHRHVA
jgi:hypothetical protein